MNREEFKEKILEVRGKVEDGLVKAYNWTQKHPIATSIGGTLIGAAVGGLVSYKIGEAKGDREAREEIGRNILDGTDVIKLKCVENGSFYNDKLLDAHDIANEKIDIHKRGNKAYAVTGMAGFMARSAVLPRRMFFWIFGMKDVRLERHFKDIRDMEKEGL